MTALAIAAILLINFPVHAGQDVRIFVEAEEADLAEPRPSALREALAQGVFQEAEALLGGELGEPRRSALRRILEPRAQEYVLDWEEREFLPTEWGAVLHVNVRVHRQALRGFLQSLGTYYTRNNVIGYRLEARGLNAEQTEVIRNLEVLSGVRQDGADSLILRLNSQADGSLQGTLDYEGLVWSAMGPELPEVWIGLWSNYFGMDRVRRTFEDDMILDTHGWTAAGDVQSFDQALREWEVSVDRIDLLGISMQPDGLLQARWRIVTTDRSGMQSRVRQYFQNRDVAYSVQ
ncbi:hypothetical protein SAMN05660653_01916 [Desulfonatronum thiosulfatophilum]|uniref:Uncharacterized protein n=1 Tax=Desulfonatronum thiosulfatophilum TaxID=617002 RepID=A0A1G6D4M1_9BACT|nr:hypothetical protein [Desulfonatronum thiosulfatophilum]SDB40116.1 hypothetical protein SAMN05660653_01916 [Desulfonatronum thiosulfatophilum]